MTLVVGVDANADTPYAVQLTGLTVTGQGGTSAGFTVSRPTNIFLAGEACTDAVPAGPGKWGGLLLHRNGDTASRVIGSLVVNGLSGSRCRAYVASVGGSPSRLAPGRYTAVLLGTGKQTFSLGTDPGSHFPLLRTSSQVVAQSAFYKSASSVATWDAPIAVSTRTALFTMWSGLGSGPTPSVASICLVPAGTVCSGPPEAGLRPQGDNGYVDPDVNYYRAGGLASGPYLFKGRVAGPSNISAFSLALRVPA